MHRFVTLAIALIFGQLTVWGQSAEGDMADRRVKFYLGGSVLSTSLGDNAKELSESIELLQKIQEDSQLTLKKVIFTGTTSLEGKSVYNIPLSQRRLEALERYIRARVDIPEDIIVRHAAGNDWERLASLVEESDMPDKEATLHVLRDMPEHVYDGNGKLVNSRKKQLMELQHGKTWYWLEKNFFAEMRNATIEVVYADKDAEKYESNPKTVTGPGPVIPKTAEEPERQPVDTAAIEQAIIGNLTDPSKVEPTTTTTTTTTTTVTEDNAPEAADEAVAVAEDTTGKKPFYMAFKTNMLYDVAAVPSVGVEFYLGKGWSIAANWEYAWWKKDGKSRYWRVYGGDLDIRKWFGKAAKAKPLTGHHLGVYGQVLTYDFEWGGKGQMAGIPGGSMFDKTSYAAGLEYGYSLPIARRLNIDFVIGGGYLGGRYYEYTPIDGHYVWQATKDRHWFGPTKAEISLVWLIGRGNYNANKGRTR